MPLLPSVLAVEDRLAWKLEQTAKLGRHAVANQDIAAGADLFCLVLYGCPLHVIML